MEGFISVCIEIDSYELENFILMNYHEPNYLFNSDFFHALKLIEKGYKDKAEEKLWQRWLVDYNRMNKDNFISFNEYKDKVFAKQSIITDSKEDLLKMHDDIQLKIAKKRGEV